MEDRKKSKKQLIQELQELRRRISELQASLEKSEGTGATSTPSEEYTRYLLDYSFDLIVLLDREGKTKYLSPSIGRLLGYKLEEVLGANAFDYFHPEDLPEITEFFNKRIGYTGFSSRVVFRIKHKDGSWRYMEAIGNNLLDDPQVQGVVVNARDITERVQLEEELSRAEEHYRTILDSASDAIFIHDLNDGELLYVNQRMTEMYGYTLEEARQLGLDAFETYQEPYTVKNLIAYGLKAAKGEPQVFEWRPVDKDGRPFWVEVNLRRARVIGRECILSIVRDITDRKTAEENLLRSEEYFRSLIENTSDIISVMDAEGRIRYVSPSITRISGEKPEEIIGKNGFENIHPDDIPQLMEVFAEGMKTPGITVGAEYRIQHKDGTWHTYQGVGQNLLDNPYIHGIVVHSTDITERKRLEEELLRSEEYFRSLIENTSDIIVVLDAEGILRYVGPSVERNSGHKPEELIGKTLFEFAHPDDIQASAKDLAYATSRPGVAQYAEIRIRHKNGSWHYYEASSNNLLDNPAVLGIVINARDITERKEAERFDQLQRDMAVALSGAITLDEALKVSLQGVLAATGMDSGGIYLIDEETGALDLVHHIGHSEAFVHEVSHVDNDDPIIKPILIGEPIYDNYETFEPRVIGKELEEGLKAMAIVPIRHEGKVIGSLNIASHTIQEVPTRSRQIIEILARQIAQSIMHARLVTALQESEEKYRLIYDYTGQPIYTYDTELRLIGVNRKAIELIGFSEEELLGRPILELDILHPDDFERTAKDIQRLFNGEVVTDELRFKRRDGSYYIAEVTGAPLYNQEGEIIAFTNIARDITELKEAEEALRESEQKFRVLAETATTVILIYRGDRLLYVNPAAVKMSGYTKEELLEMNIWDVIHPDHKEIAREAAYGRMEGELEEPPNEVVFYGKDGEERWIYAKASQIDYEGETAGLVEVIDITDRKKMEKALRESEQKFRVLAETATTAIVIYQGDKLIYVNPAAAEMSGYTEEELLEINVYEFVHPDQRDELQVLARKRLEGKISNPVYEVIYITKNGEERWAYVTTSEIEYEGQIAGLVEVVDITGRKEAEQALRESEERYRLIFDYSGEAIFTYDRELKLISINRMACDLIGYQEEELKGANIFELGILHPDEYEEAVKNNERLFSGEVVNTELKFVRKDGGILIAEVTGAPLYDQQGKVIAITNVARDVTVRKRHEVRLEKLNRCFLGLGPDPMENIKSITLSGQDILEDYDIQYCRLDKGRFSIFAPSHKSEDFILPDSAEDYICYDTISSNRGKPLVIDDLDGAPFKKDPPAKEGGYKSFLGYPTRLGDKTVGSICLYGRSQGSFAQEDINFLGMLARALTIEEERLAYEESIRHFVDIASHELRTPLSIIKGYADAFQYGDLMELNRFQMDKIRIINTKADKMTRTINDLMHLSRIERGHFIIERQEVDLETLIQSVVEQMRDKGIQNKFTLSFSDGIERCNVDPEKLGDALRVLLDNAVSYSPPQSDIDIEAAPGDSGVTISVLDRGRGIEEKDHGRIFDRFYQTEDSRHHSATGMGLGLFIAREIVEGHGGRIWYEPREGGGSIFSFNIPV
jgi:PAS domain S-box-containing protein